MYASKVSTRSSDLLACDEVADSQLSMAAEPLDAVFDGNAAAEGVEAGKYGVVGG